MIELQNDPQELLQREARRQTDLLRDIRACLLTVLAILALTFVAGVYLAVV